MSTLQARCRIAYPSCSLHLCIGWIAPQPRIPASPGVCPAGRWKATTVAVKIIEHYGVDAEASTGSRRISAGREMLFATSISHPNGEQYTDSLTRSELTHTRTFLRDSWSSTCVHNGVKCATHPYSCSLWHAKAVLCSTSCISPGPTMTPCCCSFPVLQWSPRSTSLP
jgi:hypothetical protein